MTRHDMSNSTGGEWLSPTEAAPLVAGGVSPRTLTRWAEKGVVPAVRLPNRRWRFRRADIEALVAPRACAGGAR